MIIKVGKHKTVFSSEKNPILFIMTEDERLRLIHNLTAMPPKNKTRKYLMYTSDMNESDRKIYLEDSI